MEHSSSSKIIALQIGHFSNFVGTHWWNIQNASRKQTWSDNYGGEVTNRPKSTIQHDILFREGFNGGKELVHTPRLLCIDLKGSLKTLNEDGTLHLAEEEEEARPKQFIEHDENMDTTDEISLFQTEGYKKNAFLTDVAENERGKPANAKELAKKLYNLDDVVDVWSDYLGTSYHHQSILLLNNYMHNEDTSNFNMFSQGFSMNADTAFWDTWEERMHFFAEECDTLQGFQVPSLAVFIT